MLGLGAEEERQVRRGKEAEQAAVYDGMEILSTKAAKLRFGQDLRLLEVSFATIPACLHSYTTRQKTEMNLGYRAMSKHLLV